MIIYDGDNVTITNSVKYYDIHINDYRLSINITAKHKSNVNTCTEFSKLGQLFYFCFDKLNTQC